jgi:uncharacterized repeat protein (TIGR03803 family)
MNGKGDSHSPIFEVSWSPANGALAILPALLFLMLLILLLTFVAQPVDGQTFSVIHTFTGGWDGANPWSGLTMDGAGNLYGTTGNGGAGFGTVFKLSRKNSGWVLSQPYRFKGRPDGAAPAAPVVFGPDRNLYGTTESGGLGTVFGGMGTGTVFKLQPPATACTTSGCPWKETVLYRFMGENGGWSPSSGIVFDPAGNIYGATTSGGDDSCAPGQGCGVVYKLTPSADGWTESVLYTFTGGSDGKYPYGLLRDQAGSLYGIAGNGGTYGYGVVYKLTPSNGVWAQTIVHSFQASEGTGLFGLMLDQTGNLYGTASQGGPYNGGTVFELTPFNGSWVFSLLYSFPDVLNPGPEGGVIMDHAGNLYGTLYGGVIFELTLSDGTWTERDLYVFNWNGSDGWWPFTGLVFDADGNLFGTAPNGGNPQPCNAGCGTVFEFTP